MTEFKKLMKLSRKQLNSYMNEFGENGSDWNSKADLVSDIINNGFGQDCIETFGL